MKMFGHIPKKKQKKSTKHSNIEEFIACANEPESSTIPTAQPDPSRYEYFESIKHHRFSHTHDVVENYLLAKPLLINDLTQPIYDQHTHKPTHWIISKKFYTILIGGFVALTAVALWFSMQTDHFLYDQPITGRAPSAEAPKTLQASPTVQPPVQAIAQTKTASLKPENSEPTPPLNPIHTRHNVSSKSANIDPTIKIEKKIDQSVFNQIAMAERLQAKGHANLALAQLNASPDITIYPSYYELKAFLQIELGQYQSALLTYQALLRADPYNGQNWIGLGYTHSKLGWDNIPQAIKAYQRALELNITEQQQAAVKLQLKQLSE